MFPLVVKLLIELENSQKPFRKISTTISVTISETITNKHGNEIPDERYVYPEERQEIIDGLRLKQQYKNGISKNNYSKNSQQNDSEKATNENDKEIPKKIICGKQQKIIYNLIFNIIV